MLMEMEKLTLKNSMQLCNVKKTFGQEQERSEYINNDLILSMYEYIISVHDDERIKTSWYF